MASVMGSNIVVALAIGLRVVDIASAEDRLTSIILQSEFQRIDSDKNGKVSRLEFQAAIEDHTVFVSWDVNKDGQLDVHEFMAGSLKIIYGNATSMLEVALEETLPMPMQNESAMFAQFWPWGSTPAPPAPPGQELAEMGLYRVGRRTFAIETPSSRSLDTTVFYPTVAPFDAGDDVNINHVITGAADSYLSFLGPLLGGMLWLSPIKIPAVSKLNADVLDPGASTKLPLVFFMHGDESSHHFSTSILEHISSHGFVVVASDHPGISLATSSEAVPVNSARQSLMLADIQELVGLLDSQTSEFGTAFGQLVDTESYALVGHSRGGLAAFQGGSSNKVKLAAGLMIGLSNSQDSCMTNQGWVSPSFTSYLQIGGTADPRYSSASCLDTAKKVSASDLKSMIMIQDADHTAPGGPGVCQMFARIPSALHSTFPDAALEVIKGCEQIKVQPDIVRVVKAGVTAALMGSFWATPAAYVTLRDIKVLFPASVAESHAEFARNPEQPVEGTPQPTASDWVISKSKWTSSASTSLLLFVLSMVVASS